LPATGARAAAGKTPHQHCMPATCNSLPKPTACCSAAHRELLRQSSLRTPWPDCSRCSRVQSATLVARSLHAARAHYRWLLQLMLAVHRRKSLLFTVGRLQLLVVRLLAAPPVNEEDEDRRRLLLSFSDF